MVPRENKNNAYAKFWRANKEYYGVFESGLLRNRLVGMKVYFFPFSTYVYLSIYLYIYMMDIFSK